MLRKNFIDIWNRDSVTIVNLNNINYIEKTVAIAYTKTYLIVIYFNNHNDPLKLTYLTEKDRDNEYRRLIYEED